MGDRINYIDIAKGIGIILVVFGHSSLVLHVENIWIHSFHMPLFFFISGMCFNEKRYSLKDLACRRWKQIMMPCLYFSGTVATVEMILKVREPESLLANLPHALWFLPIMFLSQIIVARLWKTIPNPIGRYSTSLILMIIWFCMANRCMIPFSLHSLPAACFFFSVGNLLGLNSKNYTKRYETIFTLVGTVVCVYALHSRLNLYENILLHPIAAVTAAVCGIFFVLSLSSNLCAIGLNGWGLTWFGKNTLAIMSTHQFLFYMSRHFIRPYIPFTPPLFGKIDVLYGLVEIILCMCITVIIVYLINRKAKWLIGK